MSKAKKARQKIDLAARDRMVLDHLPLVRAIAVRMHETLPTHVDMDDLVHAGVLGLFDAVSKFDPRKQVAFSSYAKYRIKGSILDSLRQLDWASRDLRRRQKRVEAVTRELTALLERAPSEEEIAGKLGLDIATFRDMMIDLRATGLISASVRTDSHDDLPAPDFPCPLAQRPDEMTLATQLRSTLAEALDVLPARYRRMMDLYYRQELSMKEVGELLGVNESRISQMHKAALGKLRAALIERGIESSRALAAAA